MEGKGKLTFYFERDSTDINKFEILRNQPKQIPFKNGEIIMYYVYINIILNKDQKDCQIYEKKCSKSFVVKEMQIMTTIYPFSSVRMPYIIGRD